MEKKAKHPVNPQAWAKRLAAARLMVAENKTEFAKSIGFSQQRYDNYERGAREPDIAAWKLICAKLRISVDFIMFGDAMPGRDSQNFSQSRERSISPGARRRRA
jgi:DNA-binding XRE family transcriptional regulator